MIKKTSGIILVFILWGAISAFGQEEVENSSAETVSSPAPVTQQQNVPAIKTIFAFKEELAITDKQIEELKNIFSNLQNFLIEKNKEIAAERVLLADMITKKADLKAVKKKIEDIAKFQVEVSYADVEAARKIEDTLTISQWDKWKSIQKAFQIKIQQEETMSQ